MQLNILLCRTFDECQKCMYFTKKRLTDINSTGSYETLRDQNFYKAAALDTICKKVFFCTEF